MVVGGAARHEEPAMKTLVYSSVSAEVPSVDTVLSILRTARAANKQDGIHGILLVADRLFMQVLEGPEAAVDRLMEKIYRDPRHSCIVPWLVEVHPERPPMFDDWSMAYARLGVVDALAGEGLQPIDLAPLGEVLRKHPERPASVILRGFIEANSRALQAGAA
jgi:hypothetical protein